MCTSAMLRKLERVSISFPNGVRLSNECLASVPTELGGLHGVTIMSGDTAIALDQLALAQATHLSVHQGARPRQSSNLNAQGVIAIGRLRLSQVLQNQKACDDGRTLTIVQARIRTVTRQSGQDARDLIGGGDDLQAAVRELLREIADQNFYIMSTTTTHCSQRYSARVFVKGEKDPSVLHFGLASSSDDTTAFVAATIRALSNGGLLKGRYLCAGHREAILRADKLAELTYHRTDSAHQQERAELLHNILAEINEFAAGVSMIAAKNSKSPSVLSRFDITNLKRESAHETSASGSPLWHEWDPGLANDPLTLREVVATMPATAAGDIPAIIRFFENPSSPFKMRGAISLVDHDHLHIVLGRGLQDQDEAFVLGFTMGTEKNLTRIEQGLFKLILSKLYPQPYRIAPQLLRAYDLGVRAGKEMGVRKINRVDTSKFLDMRLCDIRRELGIDSKRLKEFYAEESDLIPGTTVSERLPK